MTDSIEEAIRQATLALEEATSRILTMAHEIARLRDDRAELRGGVGVEVVVVRAPRCVSVAREVDGAGREVRALRVIDIHAVRYLHRLTRQKVCCTRARTRNHSTVIVFLNPIIEAIDPLVEGHQGLHDLISAIPAPKDAPRDALKCFQADVAWIEENHEAICGGNRGLANMIDTVTGVYLSAIYRLRFLR